MNRTYDERPPIEREDLDIEGRYDYVANEDDNEYAAQAQSTFSRYFNY